MSTPTPRRIAVVPAYNEEPMVAAVLERRDEEQAYVFQNSWGSGWGQNGRFKINFVSLEGMADKRPEVIKFVEQIKYDNGPSN